MTTQILTSAVCTVGWSVVWGEQSISDVWVLSGGGSVSWVEELMSVVTASLAFLEEAEDWHVPEGLRIGLEGEGKVGLL